MGLTAARASALSVLVFGGRPVTLGALAQAEQVSAPTITRLIVGMERDGLVRREADAARRPRRLAARRRRKARGCCTPAAAAASPRSRPTWRRLTPAERDTLAAATAILERVLQRPGERREQRRDRRRRADGRTAGSAGSDDARRCARSRALLLAPPPIADLRALAIAAAGRARRPVDRRCRRPSDAVRVRAFDRDVAAYPRRRSRVARARRHRSRRQARHLSGDGRRGRRRQPRARHATISSSRRASSARGG